jgi:hypothetical protein
MSTDEFASVNLLRKIEKARNNMNAKSNNSSGPLLIENVVGNKTPLSMDWAFDEEIENDFTLVESRKSKKR